MSYRSSTINISGGSPGSFTTLTVTGQAGFSAGSTAAPSISFTGDPDTGFYSFGVNSIGISFGGVSYGFMNSGGLQFFAPIQAAGAITANYGTAIPAGGTAGTGLLVSSTANFGVFFGSGAPSLSAAKGSLYLRSDGSTVNDRAYINTNGGTTWTALVTAA